MSKENKRQIIIALLVVFCMFLFSFLIFVIIDNNKRIEQTNSISAVYNLNRDITILNKLPVSDTLGKSFDGAGTENGIQGYSEFVVQNDSGDEVKYEILVTVSGCKKNCINSNYIKLFLTDDKDKPLDGFDSNKLPTFASLGVLDDKPGSRLLYRAKISGNSEKRFKLRVWLADTYAITNLEEEFNFVIDVRGV